MGKERLDTGPVKVVLELMCPAVSKTNQALHYMKGTAEAGAMIWKEWALLPYADFILVFNCVALVKAGVVLTCTQIDLLTWLRSSTSCSTTLSTQEYGTW